MWGTWTCLNVRRMLLPQQALTDVEPQLFSLCADVVRVTDTWWVMNTTRDSFGYLHWTQWQRHSDDVVCNLR